MAESNTTIEFNYASLSLEPYISTNKDSSKLLKEIVQKLNEDNFPLIDRYENRKGSEKRRIVNISSPFEKRGARCFGRMALIKNKAPMLWGGKDVVEHIKNDGDMKFIEITNYIINFNEDSDPVIMLEYNHAGPRLSDIVYYFRQITKNYRIARSIKSILHLTTDYSNLDKELTNVFSITAKINAGQLIHTKGANWHKSMKNLVDDSGFKDVKFELSFKREKEDSGGFVKNIRGMDFAKGILGWLKKDEGNIDHVGDLKMSYLTDESDVIVELDFLKNKTTSIINIPLFNETQYRLQDFKHAAGQEFNHYLRTGMVNDVSQKKEPNA